MTKRRVPNLRFAKKLALAAVECAAIGLPIVLSVINGVSIGAQSLPTLAPKFEVASVQAECDY